MRAARAVTLATAGCVVLGLAVSGCSQNGSVAAAGSIQVPVVSFGIPSPLPPSPLPSTPATALAALGRLPVQPAAARAQFNPTFFGSVKAPTGVNNPCNSTDYVLTRDLVDVQRSATSHCFISAGALFDPYTASWAWYLRGNSRLIQLNQVALDHVVSLSNAWFTGASAWGQGELNGFQNDPLNLLAATTADVTAKADRDAAGWLPANPPGRCLYAVDQVAVKTKYRLWVTSAERTALQHVLQGCPATVGRPHPTTPAPPQPSPSKAVYKPKAAANRPAKPAPKRAAPAAATRTAQPTASP